MDFYTGKALRLPSILLIKPHVRERAKEISESSGEANRSELKMSAFSMFFVDLMLAIGVVFNIKGAQGLMSKP